MKILLTNDDGIHAPGLKALWERLSQDHAVTAIAPDREQSAVSHAITLRKPLRAEKVALKEGYTGYAINGTPADCIKLGINEIMAEKPDMVIAGINPGANVGINIYYSGTVAAAREAALYGFPAIAAGVVGNETTHYGDAAGFVARLAETLVEKKLPFGTCLNVNFPDLPLADTAGVRICNQEITLFSDPFIKRADPWDKVYYWLGCDEQLPNSNPQSDVAALCDRYISITALKGDMTDYGVLEEIKGWGVKKG